MENKQFRFYTFVLVILLLLGLQGVVSAANYYVSPTGNDANDGTSEVNAWLSIDRGNQLGFLVPGDTVNILSGTYNITSTRVLSTSGNVSANIIYRKFGTGDAILDAGNAVDTIIQITGNYTELIDITLINSGGDGISLDADFCLIMGCTVFDYVYQGVDITGNDNLILKNTFYNTTQSGVVIRAGAENNQVYGNTISNCPYDGIWIDASVTTTRVFNNIIVSAGDGIDGSIGNICAYNNIWNSINNNYANGVTDSAGGMSVDPLFTNAGSGDYSLLSNSFCIDAGIDLGYSFNGSAPDMGAIEYTPNNSTNYYVSPTGDDNNDGLTEFSAWASIDYGDSEGLIVPGDTVNIMPGIYSLSETIILTTPGTKSAPIVYQSYQTNNKNQAVVDLNNAGKHAFELSGSHTELLGISVTNANQDGIRVIGDSCLVAYCKVYNVSDKGIRIYGSYNLFYKNIIYSVGKEGIKNEDNGDYNLIYNNTVHGGIDDGIEIHGGVLTDRVFNNIVTGNSKGGIFAKVENICGYNNVWGNLDGDYIDGVVDSAGGISVSPRFVDTLLLRFDLQSSASEIDAGLDLGYGFNGTAPDIGAVEKYNNFYVSPIGDDNNDGTSKLSAWASIDKGDSLLFPGGYSSCFSRNVYFTGGYFR